MSDPRTDTLGTWATVLAFITIWCLLLGFLIGTEWQKSRENHDHQVHTIVTESGKIDWQCR